MHKKLYYLKRLLHRIKWALLGASWGLVPKTSRKELSNSSYSIGIVTYVDRYDSFFIHLITHLVRIFPDTEIIVAINGYHDPLIQSVYLKKVNHFLKQYSNIKVVEFADPQSLSRLWNLLILNSTSCKTLILNDDIRISPFFRLFLNRSGILRNDSALINYSWSHFLISKKVVREIGWFDERFPAVGNEDEDYECRLAIQGMRIKNYNVPGLKNEVFKTENFSWENTDVVNGKYVRENQVFFNSKWDVTNEPADGYVYVRILEKYVKLKPGMETPVFHNLP